MDHVSMSEVLNALFGIALAAWSFALRNVQQAIDKLGDKFDALAEKLEKLAHRVTVIEVKQGAQDHDDIR